MTDTNATPTTEIAGPAPELAADTAPELAAVLDSHAEQIAAHESKIAELEQVIGDLRAELARVGSAFTKGNDGKPTPDGGIPASMAADEHGLQPGHAGLGTGDGPAGANR